MAFGVVIVSALLFVPVEASYLSAVGSDTIEFRIASCGPPVVAVVGADPSLDPRVVSPVASETSRDACAASAGRRVSLALALVLVGLAAGSVRARQLRRPRRRPGEPVPVALDRRSPT